MLDRNHLWEIFRFRDVRFMTTDTQKGDIKLRRREGCWVVGVLSQRTVAGFAVDANMFADSLLFKYVAVTGFAGLVTSIVRSATGGLVDRIPTVMAILSETLGHHIATQCHKGQPSNNENSSQSKKMPGVFEIVYHVIVKYRNMSQHRYALHHLMPVPISQLRVMSFRLAVTGKAI